MRGKKSLEYLLSLFDSLERFQRMKKRFTIIRKVDVSNRSLTLTNFILPIIGKFADVPKPLVFSSV